MPLIVLKTFIKATPERCFHLSRNIDLHVKSMEHTGERAIAGKTRGWIGLGETVTWQARHFGIPFKMTIRITAMDMPGSFTDEMIKGPFKELRHQHLFTSYKGGTQMTDLFYFQSPFGILGMLVDSLFMKHYMRRLLRKRNRAILQKAVPWPPLERTVMAEDITGEDILLKKGEIQHCAVHLRQNGMTLMRSLLKTLQIDLNTRYGVYELNSKARSQHTGSLDDQWTYSFQRETCRFENTQTGQVVGVLLQAAPQFNRINANALYQYVETTDRFNSLAAWFNHDIGKIEEAIEFLAAEGTFSRPTDRLAYDNSVVV